MSHDRAFSGVLRFLLFAYLFVLLVFRVGVRIESATTNKAKDYKYLCSGLVCLLASLKKLFLVENDELFVIWQLRSEDSTTHAIPPTKVSPNPAQTRSPRLATRQSLQQHRRRMRGDG